MIVRPGFLTASPDLRFLIFYIFAREWPNNMVADALFDLMKAVRMGDLAGITDEPAQARSPCLYSHRNRQGL
jgi:hypothetical protein